MINSILECHQPFIPGPETNDTNRERLDLVLIQGGSLSGLEYEVPHGGFRRFLNSQYVHLTRLIGPLRTDIYTRISVLSGYLLVQSS